MGNDAEDLLTRLKPYAQGCFAGKTSEWPQLKPLLRDIYAYLSAVKDDGFLKHCRDCGRYVERKRWVRKGQPLNRQPMCYDCSQKYDPPEY